MASILPNGIKKEFQLSKKVKDLNEVLKKQIQVLKK